MRIKNHRILCFLLVIFVSLSGMCLEKVEADSFFAYAPMEKTDSSISCESEISETHPCTTEMLGVRNHAGMQRLASQFISQKREGKATLNFLCFNLFSLDEKQRKFFISSEAIQFYSQCQEGLVANYIHKIDGKKRI